MAPPRHVLASPAGRGPRLPAVVTSDRLSVASEGASEAEAARRPERSVSEAAPGGSGRPRADPGLGSPTPALPGRSRPASPPQPPRRPSAPSAPRPRGPRGLLPGRAARRRAWRWAGDPGAPPGTMRPRLGTRVGGLRAAHGPLSGAPARASSERGRRGRGRPGWRRGAGGGIGSAPRGENGAGCRSLPSSRPLLGRLPRPSVSPGAPRPGPRRDPPTPTSPRPCALDSRFIISFPPFLPKPSSQEGKCSPPPSF